MIFLRNDFFFVGVVSFFFMLGWQKQFVLPHQSHNKDSGHASGTNKTFSSAQTDFFLQLVVRIY